MRRFCSLLVAGAVFAPAAVAATTVGVDDSSGPWLGFMNVFDLGGGYQFGSPWGVPDLVAEFDDSSQELRLAPNSIGDPDPYWYTPSGGPGAAGNKIMDANLYQEYTDVFNGQTLTFEGTILSNSFTSAHTATAFIKDFAPDYSSFNISTVPLTPGAFSVSLATDPGAGRHVQFGFEIIGVNVWITDVAPFGEAIISTIPEPTSLLLLALGGLATLRRR